ncbi:MAG: phenylalanine--tRNA ligase subunit beta [Microbacteriaceae bacterium]|nr:phenylalanine--tRNA ligase subunit beta [Microbacteriaceae bacterium]
MRVPLSWLSEFTELPKDSKPEQLMAELVKIGLEEEEEHYFEINGPVVVGKVIEFVDEPQSNGKTIRWCQVDVGESEPRGIVCGASNFEQGDKVVVTLPGSVLPGNFAIAARETYGHVSDGMIASVKELGMGDDHEGILVLSTLGLDPELGEDAIKLLGLDDSAAEINVTPDRGYCFSIRGVAREYSHATLTKFTDPAAIEPVSGKGFQLKIEDKSPIRGRTGCSRFDLVELSDIDASAPTPAWMVSRLKLAGMRSISLVVDITNYVMLETGQPTHAYDLDLLTGGITVRRANNGEKLKTLDGQIRELNQEDLLITDESGPIGIAGVMGGESTEVSFKTKRVLIEAANFDPISIARSARRHKLPSEASKRFERGVDPLVADRAIARIAQLLGEYGSAKLTGFGASFQEIETPAEIVLPTGFASELVGVEYPVELQKEILEQIGCQVKIADDLIITPPSWRPDLNHKTDLVEEIARIDGYHKIGSRLPVAPPGNGLTEKQQLRRKLTDSLAASGMVETLNYPFVSEQENSLFGEKNSVRLENPIQEESPEMRTSMIPGLLQAAARNISRGLTSGYLYELGSVFIANNDSKPAEFPDTASRPSESQINSLNEQIPSQPEMLAGVGFGDRELAQPGSKSQTLDYKLAVDTVLRVADLMNLEFEIRNSENTGLHPGRTADVLAEGKKIGFVGELHPDLSDHYHLPRVSVFELNLSEIWSLIQPVTASAVHTYPAATQDLSLVVDENLDAQQLLSTVIEGCGELLESIRTTDVYKGQGIADGKKSITFALVFRATDRTLTQEEATESRNAAVALAHKLHGAELRGV